MSAVTPDNPLLEDSPLPRFDAIRPEHVEPAISRLIAEQRARVAQIELTPNPTFKTVVEPLEVDDRLFVGVPVNRLEPVGDAVLDALLTVLF